MKKLLVLMLVLGMASLASAALDLTIGSDTDGTSNWDGVKLLGGGLTIDAVLANSVTDYTLQVDLTGDLTLVTSSVVFADGWMFGNLFTGGDPGDGATSANLTAGDFNAKPAGFGAFTGLGVNGDLGTITLTSTDFTGVIGSAIITVPEPMTMVLLGLGGLFLRRRK